MISKTIQVKNFLKNGEILKALKIAKNFKKGNKEDLDKIIRAYECYIHSDWYKQIHVDIEKAKKEGVSSLKKLIDYTE
jgi:hypothetical protein